MEPAVLRQVEERHRVVQRPAHFPRLKRNREQFLDILIDNGACEQFFHMIITEVPLELRQIERTPCAEAHILSAPVKKCFGCFPERLSAPQIILCQPYHFSCLIMQPVIHSRPDQRVKGIEILLTFIQFHCSDFNYLKRQPGILKLFPVGALIPFEIEHNIIHCIIILFYGNLCNR